MAPLQEPRADASWPYIVNPGIPGFWGWDSDIPQLIQLSCLMDALREDIEEAHVKPVVTEQKVTFLEMQQDASDIQYICRSWRRSCASNSRD